MNETEMAVTLTRIETNLNNLIEKLDGITEDNRKCHEDHETRIRAVERLAGKLLGIATSVSVLIGIVVTWASNTILR